MDLIRRRPKLFLAGAAATAYIAWSKKVAARNRSKRGAGKGGKGGKGARPGRKPPKYPRALMWKTVMKMINLRGSKVGHKHLLGIMGCAAAFVLIDLRKARLQGDLFKQVFLGNIPKFRGLLAQNILAVFALASFNKILANVVSSLGRHWHSSIVNSIHDRYFRNMAYYQIQGMTPYDRITGDVPLFTRQLSLVATDTINSCFQFMIYGTQLINYGGRVEGMGGMLVATPLAYMVTALGAISAMSPNFAQLQKKQRSLEGSYRSVQSRLQNSAESVALYGGEEYEERVINDSFANLTAHISKQIKGTWTFDVAKDFFVKYFQQTVMMVTCLGPFFKQKRTGSSLKESADIMFEMRYLGDLILHNMWALAQVARLLNTVRSLGGLVDRVGALALDLEKIANDREKAQTELALTGAEDTKGADGLIMEGDHIAFEDVTIVTPTGNTLCTGLTFDVKEHQHLIVCGPNGAGKSSIFRCLGTLWPIPKGTIIRPGGGKEGLISDVFYLPQKPYNVLGSLLDQITYPDPPDSTKHGKLTDSKLRALLRMVELEYLMDMSAQDTVNWEDKLSLGETQRLAMARLFWHKPKFAILDECTAAVSLKMEKRLFVTCRRMGITLITISHRPALQEYHNRMLILDGNGGFSVQEIESTAGEGTRELGIAGKTREEAFDAILHELEEQGDLGSHTKQGASLDAMETTTLGTGLWKKLARLNSLMFASRTEEMVSLGSLAGLVLVRTWMSNSIAHLNGDALKHMLSQDVDAFIALVGRALLQSIGQSILAPTLDHLEQHMSLVWRERLTKHIVGRYMQNLAYFKLKETMPDMQQAGEIDQIVTEDVRQLTEGVANLWHDFIKPVIDIFWFARAMWSLTGVRGLQWQWTYTLVGAAYLRLVKPNLAKLTAVKEKLDGEFEHVHARLRVHAESVAFFNGGATERRIIDKHFEKKMAHQKMQKRKEHIYGVSQQFLGYFLPQNLVWALSMLYQQQYTAAMPADHVLTMKEQGELSHNLRYLGSVTTHSISAFGNLLELYGKAESLIGHVDRVSKLMEALEKVELEASTGVVKAGDVSFESGGDTISFNDATIMTPNLTQTLAKDLNFKLSRVEDRGLLITGPNGVGKTSVFRVLCNLWRLQQGKVSAPRPKVDVLFVPTKPYMPTGRLADQMTYPQRLSSPISEENKAKLSAIAEKVKLSYLIEREGLETFSETFDRTFSLGEQQRLNVARVFWHKPRFACLDECTSAVALDGEEEIYEQISKIDCTVLTASQKPWLTNYHSTLLQLKADGKGGWLHSEITEKDKFKGKVRLDGKAYVDKRQGRAS
jgi:ABC-type uncharacterized transport system fused permease/ATPase subunit